tara:strand:- start:334 stop:465 length:132 start_codon:yes stop_codon:yes gene_type:complete
VEAEEEKSLPSSLLLRTYCVHYSLPPQPHKKNKPTTKCEKLKD